MLTPQFVRRLLLLVEITPVEKDVADLRRKLLELVEGAYIDVNHEWDDVTWRTVGPNDPPALLLEMVNRVIVVPVC